MVRLLGNKNSFLHLALDFADDGFGVFAVTHCALLLRFSLPVVSINFRLETVPLQLAGNTIEINMLEQLGDKDTPPPVEPIEDCYLM